MCLGGELKDLLTALMTTLVIKMYVQNYQSYYLLQVTETQLQWLNKQ